MRAATKAGTNTYLSKNFAPVAAEFTAFDLRVIGRLPVELNGRYVRNGPNPIDVRDPDAHHWFLGDGMVHGICLREGRAAWYRNRYVGSPRVERHFRRSISGPNWSGSDTGPNTNVVGFAGTTWAMVEAGAAPVELTYELESVARNDFFGTLPGAFTAHPKLDPATGEHHGVAYAPNWPGHCQYVVVDRDGRVRRSVDIPIGPTMLHDLSLTQRFAIIYDFPVTVDPTLAATGAPFPFAWNPAHGSRIGLLAREQSAASLVWVDAPLCYSYHPLNAYDRDDGTVVVDLCVYDTMFHTDRNGPFGDTLPRLERWEIDPRRRTLSTTVVDEAPQEFPRHADHVGTSAHRYGYTTALTGTGPGATLKHDLVTGERTSYDHGPGRGAGEAVFVAREGATAEDDGWLLLFTHDHDGTSARFTVLDAQDLPRGPVAEVVLPQRVPYGFHGNWISDAAVPPGS